MAGRLSEQQAQEISWAAAANPRAEKSLLEAAQSESVLVLREQCRKVRAAAIPDELVAYEKIRRDRSLRCWTDHDGSIRLDGKLTPDAGGELVAAVHARADVLFNDARKAGRREPSQAYAADALVELVTRDGSDSCRAPKAMVHVLVDHAALVRGRVLNGERCEIPGIGPIPVASARAYTNDAIIKAVATNNGSVKRSCTLVAPCRLERGRCSNTATRRASCPAATHATN